MSMIGELEYFRLQNGSIRYRLLVTHRELGEVREFKGADPEILEAKATNQARRWNEKYRKQQEKLQRDRERTAATQAKEAKKQSAEERTLEAEEAWAQLGNLLAHTLDVDDTVDWSSLEDHSPYAHSRPRKPRLAAPPTMAAAPIQPARTDAGYQDKPGCAGQVLDLVYPAGRRKRLALMDEAFEEEFASWEQRVQQLTRDHEAALSDLAGC